MQFKCDILSNFQTMWAPKNTNWKKPQIFQWIEVSIKPPPSWVGHLPIFYGCGSVRVDVELCSVGKKGYGSSQHSFESCGHDIRDRVSVYQCISYLDFRYQELNLPSLQQLQNIASRWSWLLYKRDLLAQLSDYKQTVGGLKNSSNAINPRHLTP